MLLKLIYNWDAVHIIKTIGSSPFCTESEYLRPSRFSSNECDLSNPKLFLSKPSGWKAGSGYGPHFVCSQLSTRNRAIPTSQKYTNSSLI